MIVTRDLNITKFGNQLALVHPKLFHKTISDIYSYVGEFFTFNEKFSHQEKTCSKKCAAARWLIFLVG